MTRVLGLKAALILLVLIAIAPVFAVVVQASLAERQLRLGRAEASLRSLVELAAAHQERQVESARQLLTAIAHAPPVIQDDSQACGDYLRKLQAAYPEGYGAFGILDPQGRLDCRAEASPSVNSADRRFFRVAVATGRFSVGGFTVSRASGRQVLPFGLPVQRGDGGGLRGVAYVALDLAETSGLLRNLSIPPETTLLVADSLGVVLGGAGPNAPAAGAMLPAHVLRAALDGGQSRFERITDAAGEEWLFAMQSVGRAGEDRLHVAGLVGSRALLAPTTKRLYWQLGWIALIALLAAAMAWAFADRVLIRPMRGLLDNVDSLVHEDHLLDQPPPGAAVREVGDLHGRFHDMARRLAERAVQRDGALAEMEHQNDLLQSVLESMAEGVLVIDARQRFVHINGAAYRILPGLPRLGSGAVAAIPPAQAWGIFELDGVTPCSEDRRPTKLALAGQAVENFRYRVRGELAGGREIVIRGGARPIERRGHAPTGAVIVFSDITDAYRAERALRDSEQRYRSLFESNPHPMWVFDTATLRFLTVNDAAVAHYGYSREEFLGMTIADIRPPQDAEVLRRHLRELDGDLGTPAIWLHRRRDGSMVHVEVTSHALTYDGRPARMVLAHDVTERLLAQQALQTLNETLERRVDERTRELAVANEELESFSYSVSHDLRAPLQVIDGFSRALASRHAERLDGQARHYLERIRENTRQMGQLIDDLLALARVTRAELVTEDFDLSVLAQRTVEKLRQRFPDREVDLVVKQPMPCTGDQRLLAIVMDNLVGNAWKFTSRVAHARIEVGCRAGEDGIPMYFVADNGAGFDMAYADKLFKAFQRLHGMAEFEGTGIGLATVHRIVTRHGGRVWAASEPGHGATFGFTLTGGVKPIP